MQPIVTAEEMRWCDDTTIRSYGVPSLFLMENAGAGVARTIRERFGPLKGKRILIFCGKGNNGGDGFVVARHLQNESARIDVLLLTPTRLLSGDAKKNFDILKKLAQKCSKVFSVRQFSSRLLSSLDRPDIIVDAIFGTGFSGSVKQPYARAINWINSQNIPVVAIDIPSGVNGTTGEVGNVAIKASLTVTMALRKLGSICNQGKELSGQISVVDIGVPRQITEDTRLRTHIVELSDVQASLPIRSVLAHKYSVGKVFILAGARNYTGAAVLCTMSALRAGAGAVFLGVPDAIYPIIAKKVTEPVVIPFPSTKEGTLSLAALDKILDRMNWADVVVIGPGLSMETETAALVKMLITEGKKKILLDADGLNVVAESGKSLFKKSKASFILTPHTGELSRLTGIPAKQIEANRVMSVRNYAKESGATIVLKGSPTATAAVSGSVFLNPTGNPGMATVGSGDVLAGIIASLWAQGMEEPAAAYAGVFVHGFSGDLAKKKYGERSLLAHDLIDFLPEAYQRIHSGETA